MHDHSGMISMMEFLTYSPILHIMPLVIMHILLCERAARVIK
jgi:hypothetical protein